VRVGRADGDLRDEAAGAQLGEHRLGGSAPEVLGPGEEKIVSLRGVGEQHQLPVAERVGLGHERGP
jgi:hypothetical protein